MGDPAKPQVQIKTIKAALIIEKCKTLFSLIILRKVQLDGRI